MKKKSHGELEIILEWKWKHGIQNLWSEVKAAFREKCIELNTNIRKEESSQIMT